MIQPYRYRFIIYACLEMHSQSYQINLNVCWYLFIKMVAPCSCTNSFSIGHCHTVAKNNEKKKIQFHWEKRLWKITNGLYRDRVFYALVFHSAVIGSNFSSFFRPQFFKLENNIFIQQFVCCRIFFSRKIKIDTLWHHVI